MGELLAKCGWLHGGMREPDSRAAARGSRTARAGAQLPQNARQGGRARAAAEKRTAGGAFISLPHKATLRRRSSMLFVVSACSPQLSSSQASSAAGMAATSGSSRFNSERVATMPRHPEARSVCASRRQRPSTYFDSMAQPPRSGPTKSISLRVRDRWYRTRSKPR